MNEMPRQSGFFRSRIDQLSHGLDLLLFVFSTYAVPIIVGLVSLLALFAWKEQYPVAGPQQLEIQVVKESAGVVGPAQALAQLRERPRRPFHDTQLSEVPVWLSFIVPKDVEHTPLMVEFPSRHAMDIACWDARTLNPLGSGSRQGTVGGISAVKAGFALELSSTLKDGQVVCRTSAIGPARLSALIWRANDLQIAAHEFHRKSGLLDGGITVLAIFVLITALINRSSLYILFAAWLLVNLRMGAMSAGWDSQWLGNLVPQDWLPRIRLITTAVYYVLTVTLFKVLFRDDLTKVGSLLLMRIAQWTCLPLLLLSAVMTYQSYLPSLWVSTGLGIGILAYFLARILQKTRSRVALWYCASITISLVASLYEVLAAALGIQGMIGSINFVTAALSSSLLAALAIAEQMRQEHKQRLAAQAELEYTCEAMPIGLFTLDLQGRFISANQALLAMLGLHALKAGRSAWHQFFSEGAWPQLYDMVHDQQDGELELRSKSGTSDGSPRRFLVKATLAHDKIEGYLQDVTEKSKATEDLKFLANNDPLTKVLNRRGIEKVLESAMAKLAEGKPLALAYLDLDRFKLINELYGHNAGDDVLQQVCQRVNSVLSGGMEMGRVGGDEFVIVMPETRMPLAELIGRGIVDSIGRTPYLVGDKAFHVRGSIGLIEVNPGAKIKDAVSTADRACREAKAGHSEGLVVYEKNAAAFQAHEAELKLVERFAGASATDGLFLEMQPIMSLTAPHDSLNFEVLLRMRDPDGRLVPTGRLIAAAESSGYMSVIDRWVLSTTLAWLSTNYDRLGHTKFICMNLNGASLNDERFLEDVVVMLTKNIQIASHLCYEITESVALHDLNNTRRFIDTVRGCGARVALDDFGAGYTSFSYLKDLPADLLKIDGSFIVNMNSHPANVAIVEAIVNLARNLGMKTIAEWAEDNATVQTLAEIGVDYVQGFAVARPQLPDKMLSAASSASFIQDEQLAQFAKLLGQADPSQLLVDLMGQDQIKKVH